MTGRLPLRGRLALLVTLAVAISVAGASVGAWFVVRGQLRKQVDVSLTSTPPPQVRSSGPFTPPQLRIRAVQPFYGYVSPTGEAQLSTFDGDELTIRDSDRAIAAASQGGPVLRDDRTVEGVHIRVMTVAVPGGGGAFVVGRPLTETDDALHDLRLLLLLIGGLGIAAAGAVGLLVARSGLRPVDDLTAKAEDIARTQQLGEPLEVRGSDEVARLATAFNAMTAALDSSRQRQAQLVADAGHELRTPLTSLRTNIDLLLRAEGRPEGLPEEDRARLMADLDGQVDELSLLAGELVDLARGERTVTLEPIDLAEPVARAVERARARAGPATVADHLESWPCQGDAALLERAVVNLLDNALKFGPPDQVVRVALVDGVVSVLDQGPGIAEADLDHVTERFWRAESSRSLPGSGLGLAIAAQAATLHEGTLQVANHRDGGAVVRLAVPGQVVGG